MKTTLAFDEPPFPPRSVTPAGFAPLFSPGAPLPTSPLEHLLAALTADPLQRARLGLAPFPSPQPKLEELVATLWDNEVESAGDSPDSPAPGIDAITPELRAAWGIVDAVELLQKASWQLLAMEDLTLERNRAAMRTKEALGGVRQDRAALGRIVNYLLDLASFHFADPDAPPTPSRPVPPVFPLSPERKQATQRPTAGAVLPSPTKQQQGSSQ